jgi:hypothetical protein
MTTMDITYDGIAFRATAPSFGEAFTIKGTTLDYRARRMDPTPFIAMMMLTRKLDKFVASAWDIPIEQRHAQHDAALEKCAGLVIWLDTRNEPVRMAVDTIAKVLPAFIYLLGRHSDLGIRWKGFDARKAEMDSIRDTLKEVAAMIPTKA